ncbi:Ankyrin repeat protein [Pandoravirus kuranda]|uniref:Ankyrin repeat protein n=2 Tax=Pandoravirus TaxID=2060084 RepID=A0AA95ECG5_9VIRU|nr:Ankyrin repeat domain containing protein [Pandoravirus neocaledonia]AVK75663.1 Ankyrin repeat domain containing protein [Pandoravirus neocaledonia]WBR14225.1 Ankyrin repeat protein [Pandoravirus kuranda]
MQGTTLAGREGQGMTTGLAAMPSEVILGIGHFLERPRDAVACILASPIFSPCLVRDLAVRHFHDDPKGAIDAGAPLAVVAAVLSVDVPIESLLVPAVRRGDQDIVDWLCCRLEDEEHPSAVAQETHADVWCGCPNTCMYSHHRWHRHFEPGTGQGIKAAMVAIDARRADLLGALLRTEVPSLDRSKRTQIMCMTRAAKVGDVRIVAMLHGLARTGRFTASGRSTLATCGCCREVACEAVLGGHVPLLDWLRENGCDAAPHAHDEKMAGIALSFRTDPPLEWMFVTAALDRRSINVAPDWMRSAATNGSLACVRFMHDHGLAPCDVSVLHTAARHGRLNVLKWAAGEAVDNLPPRRSPVEAWHSPTIAWAAAMRGNADVVAWMLSRPDMASAVTPKMIACALTKGYADVALAAHASGMLPLDRWDAVEVAARSGNADAVRAIIEHGGIYKLSALVTALEKGHQRVVACLCDRYGTADAQIAIDSMTSYDHANAWTWLRDRVPGLCVAHPLAAQWATSYGDLGRCGTLCQCARCTPSAPP